MQGQTECQSGHFELADIRVRINTFGASGNGKNKIKSEILGREESQRMMRSFSRERLFQMLRTCFPDTSKLSPSQNLGFKDSETIDVDSCPEPETTGHSFHFLVTS